MSRMRMKFTAMFPLLLLLVCSASTDQTASETGQETAAQACVPDNRVHQVAFSASLLAEGEGTTGPFDQHTPLIYKHVVTNIGNAYNPNTGVFTAPVRGVNHFDWHMAQYADSSHSTGVDLMKNSDRVFMAWEHNSFGFGSSSNGVNLFLELGESVYLRLWKGTSLFDNPSHHTTFSGHLLFPMTGK